VSAVVGTAGVVVALCAALARADAQDVGSPQGSTDPIDAGTRSVRVFRDADGLPQSTVHAITLDSSGLLWIGTQDGAAVYNGRDWRIVDLPTRARSNFVRAILPFPDGSLWFGTQEVGLWRLDGEVWSEVPLGVLHPSIVRVNALARAPEADAGEVWVATHDHGLIAVSNAGSTAYGTAEGLPSERVWGVHLSAGRSGDVTVWAGTEGGLACLPPGQSRFSTGPGFPRTSVNSFLETEEKDGTRTLWVGTYGGGLARLRAGVWSTVTTKDGLPSDFLTSLTADRSGHGAGTIWVGTDGGGVARVREGRIEVLDTVSGLPSDAVYAVLETTAEEGVSALWVGTRNGGLARVRDDLWRSFKPIPSPTTLPVTAVLETRERDGTPVIWLGTDGGGLARLHRGRWTVFDVSSGALRSNHVLCLLETRAATREPSVWVGTRNGGLSQYTNGRWTVHDRASGALPNDLVQSLLETSDESGEPLVLVGTRDGLAVLRGGRWSSLTTTDGLPGSSVLSMIEAPGGTGSRTVWLGTNRGLARRSGERFEKVELPPGLLNDTVQTLAVTTGHGGPALWAGTDGGGVAVTDLSPGGGGFVLNDTSTPALPNNVIYDIVEDGAGRPYVLTNRGVTRLEPRGRRLAEWATYTFTVDDGLPSNQGNRGAAMIDRTGRVWVGTVGGAAVLDPSAVSLDGAAKRLRLEARFLTRNCAATLVHGHALEYFQNHVTFTGSLLSYFRETDTRYRSQLVGLESVPSEWRSEPTREFPRLPDGDYLFRVWGRDYAGNISGPVEMAFSIRPAPWRTWWAFVLYGVALASAVVGTIRLRLRSHRIREAQLSELVDARTRELREANQLLIELSYVDALTGIANRRRFEERLGQEWRRAIRARSPLSLIMIDIDGFKAFNDAYGHPAGDECLRQVASALADSLPRAGDSLARYGGEEFAVILPLTELAGALKVAEQLRRRVEELAISDRPSPFHVVTISCGVATSLPTTSQLAQDLIRLADEALYKAKQAGKNRTRAEATETSG
jgi:diguanylate cyclase (GGDEF)-like protein